MNDPTNHDLKIQDAQDCIRAKLDHVGGLSRCYATRAEALASAWKTLATTLIDS